MDRRELEALIAGGATLAVVARAMGVDPSTARRRLRKLGLETAHMRTVRVAAEARSAGAWAIEGSCARHGAVCLVRDTRGTYRCLSCRAERVAARRRRIKEILVAEAGGRCRLCGYDRCHRALEFHHLDPTVKRFGLAYQGQSRSLARAREEARKCVLLCSNCHMEVEAGVAEIPLPSWRIPGQPGDTVRGSSIGGAAPC